jgi:hypothetical protein
LRKTGLLHTPTRITRLLFYSSLLRIASKL